MPEGSFLRRHPRLSMAAFLGAIGVAILALDVLVTSATAGRRFDRLMGYYAEKERIDRLFRTASEVFHHGLRPATSVEEVPWGSGHYSMHTNSLGFRDARPREVPLQSDLTRILMLGDSFVEGVGVDFEESFVGLLAARLAERGIEVLNGAAVSYAPSIYFAKLRHLLEDRGLELDRVVVLLDISDIQDEAEIYRLADDGTVADRQPEAVRRIETSERDAGVLVPTLSGPGWFQRLKGWTLSHSTLPSLVWERIRPLLGQVSAQRRRRLGIDNVRSQWTLSPERFAEYGERGLREAAAHMDRLAELQAAAGIELTLVVYPWPDQIFYYDLHSIQVRFWSEWAAAREVGFLSLFPDFIPAGASESARIAIIERYYQPGDVHWNAAGHRLVAERLWQFLARRQGSAR